MHRVCDGAWLLVPWPPLCVVTPERGATSFQVEDRKSRDYSPVDPGQTHFLTVPLSPLKLEGGSFPSDSEVTQEKQEGKSAVTHRPFKR